MLLTTRCRVRLLCKVDWIYRVPVVHAMGDDWNEGSSELVSGAAGVLLE